MTVKLATIIIQTQHKKYSFPLTNKLKMTVDDHEIPPNATIRQEYDTIGAIPESRFERDWAMTLVLIPNDMKDIFKNDNLRFCDSNRICFEAERLRQQGNINEAIDKLRRAIKLDNDNPQPWCLL